MKKILLGILFIVLLSTVAFAADNEVISSAEGQRFFLLSEEGLEAFYQGDIFLLLSNINELTAQFILSGITLFFCLVSIAFRKSFFEQASFTLRRQPLTVISSGILTYFIALALIIVFFASLIGFPLAILLAVILFFLISLGEASIGIMFIEIFADKFNVVLGVYQNAFLGVLAIELLKFIPYVKWAVQFLILPILALGVFATTVSNAYSGKIFYETNDTKRSVQ